jgi:type II secretory pathway component PulF
MSQITALENLLQQAGYGKRRSARLAEVIDAAAIPGMTGDDLYVAFMRWKQVAGLTDSAVKLMTADSFTQTQQYDKLRQVMLEMLEDVKNGQQYLGFVPLVDSSRVKPPVVRTPPSSPVSA